jgi:hypothetical protein
MEISRVQHADPESIRVTSVSREHGSGDKGSRRKSKKRPAPARTRSAASGYEDYSPEELDEGPDSGAVSILL